MTSRVDTDGLGSLDIPADRRWGIHTERARRNFPVSDGARTHLCLIYALAQVKKAAALVNAKIGELSELKAKAIAQACDEILNGYWDTEFPLDPLQGGAGTSTNMNVNEVIAHRAGEISSIPIHPIDDVNRHQSTNDVYPTAVKIACILAFRDLSEKLAMLQSSLQTKETEFAGVFIQGRTEIQDALPLSLGRVFSGFAEAISRDRWRTFKCEERLRVVNLGGTAIGTGKGAPRDYIFSITERLRDVTGLGLSRGDNLIAETAHMDPLVEVSGILKAHAGTLLKLSEDLRWMNYLAEIELPKLQAGSSIMPGKVNPVCLEMTAQVALKVIANDLLVTEAVSRSHFQIVELLPLAAHALLESLHLLCRLCPLLTEHVSGISRGNSSSTVAKETPTAVFTSLISRVGYDQATQLSNEFHSLQQPITVAEFLNRRGFDEHTTR